MIESNYGDGMFEQLLKPVLARIYPCTTEEYRVSGQKEALAEAVGYWSTKVRQDTKKAEQAHRDKLREKELAGFIDLVRGKKPGATKYAGSRYSMRRRR